MKGRLWLAAAATAGALALTGCVSTAHESVSIDVGSASGDDPSRQHTSPRPGFSWARTREIAACIWHGPLMPGRWQARPDSSAARVVIDRFGTGPGSSDVMFNAPLASTDGQNSLIRQTQVKHAENRDGPGFRSKSRPPPSAGQIDLISGIQEMEDHLRELNAVDPDVIVFGDAVQTAGSVNLADPVQLADPSQTLEKVKAQGLLQASAAADGTSTWSIRHQQDSAHCRTSSSGSSGGSSSPLAAATWSSGTAP